MGCNIHLYVEYRPKKKEENFTPLWRNFGGRINPGRNYLLFGIMSKGVRTDPSFSFDPKGTPEDMAYASLNDSRIFISESGEENYVPLERAKKYESYGCKITTDGDGKPIWVESPDWHSHSWLTTNEFEQAMDFYNKQNQWKEAEYEAVLCALKKFEELDNEARIVFWFDN
jgi:hypothetical protein